MVGNESRKEHNMRTWSLLNFLGMIDFLKGHPKKEADEIQDEAESLPYYETHLKEVREDGSWVGELTKNGKVIQIIYCHSISELLKRFSSQRH